MEEKNLSDEIEELTHGKIIRSADENLCKEYDSLKNEFSLPEYGIEIEKCSQENQEQEEKQTEKQYNQEKADLQKMDEDDIVILKSGEDSDFFEN